MCTDTIGDQLKDLGMLKSSAKRTPGSRRTAPPKAPRAPKKASALRKPKLENWEPVVPQEPRRRPVRPAPRAVVHSERDSDIAWKGQVRFHVPAGSKLEPSGASGYVRVPISGVLGLIIKGDPSYLAGIDLEAGSVIQGELTVRRSQHRVDQLANATLIVGGPSREPRCELRIYRSDASGSNHPKKLKGWCKLLPGASIQVQVIESAPNARA